MLTTIKAIFALYYIYQLNAYISHQLDLLLLRSSCIYVRRAMQSTHFGYLKEANSIALIQ